MGTREEIRESVIRVFKRDDKDTEINEAINDTLREMAGCCESRKLQDQKWVPLIKDQEDYALPENLLRLRHPIRLIDTQGSNSDSNSYPLKFMTKGEYDMREPNPNATTKNPGTVWAYCIWKNCILVTDLPDETDRYRLEANVGNEITILSSDIDEPVFRDRWDETIKHGTLGRMYYSIQLFGEGDKWRDIYVNGFTGDNGQIMGGLKLLRMLDNDVAEAPLIVRNNNL